MRADPSVGPFSDDVRLDAVFEKRDREDSTERKGEFHWTWMGHDGEDPMIN